MKNLVLSALLSGLLAGLFGCANRPANIEQTVNFGDLIDLREASVCADEACTALLPNFSSHGIVLTNGDICEVLLLDGRIGWVRGASYGRPLMIKSESPSVEMTNLPFSEMADEDFQWMEVEAIDEIQWLGISLDRFSESPLYVQKQGQRFIQQRENISFKWPHFLLKISGQQGWASATSIAFTLPVSEAPLRPSGLIQKPFLPLVQNKIVPAPINGEFIDVTHSHLKTSKVTPQPWELVQAIIPNDFSTNIDSILLLSGTNNCHLFLVKLLIGTNLKFGYCTIDKLAPTPQILTYNIEDKWLQLSVAEIYTDKVEAVEFLIDGNSKKEWLKIRPEF